MTMYYQYLQINSPDEVNVSSTTRDVLEKQLNLWSPQSMIISRSKTKDELEIDSKKRIKVFEGAYREILSLLYQNLWTQFRIEEAHASLIGIYIFKYLCLCMCVH
jgi:hypothetical protein